MYSWEGCPTPNAGSIRSARPSPTPPRSIGPIFGISAIPPSRSLIGIGVWKRHSGGDERLGLPREAKWDDVLAHLPPLPTRDGLYVAAETATETFTRPGQNTSHPCMLAPLGILDGAMVDRATMKRTLHRVAQNWDWGNTWGWDYPMMAMTAARLGEGQTAIDLLLKDTAKNHYLVNGHNPQIDGTATAVLARKRRAAVRHGADGRRLGRGTKAQRPGFPG